MPEVIMPKMGDGMDSGVLTAWLKSRGDEVSVGDPIAEIETDKGSMELEAEDAGVLEELLVSEGDEVPVGERIAMIGDGSGGSGLEDDAQGEREGDDAQDEDEDDGQGDGEDDDAQGEVEDEGSEAQAAADGDDSSRDGGGGGRVRASPIVRRLAKEHGLDLEGLEGSGPDGRIVERDVRAALEDGGGRDGEQQRRQGDEDDEQAAQATGEEPSGPALPAPTGAPGARIEELSRMQRSVGERMQQSWQQAPHHFATVEVEVDELLALRKDLNEEFEDEGVKLSINDFVVRACAVALGEHPMLNAMLTSEGVEVHETVNLAIAVALEEGLVTPVIRDAANKTVSAISEAAKDLAKRAKDGGLDPDEYQGGTFTISNMGMYGVESFTAIVNPPSVSIVAVGSVARRPAFDDDDNVVPRSFMKLTVSSDHRVVNGADHALYLGEVKRLLERPRLLTV